MIVYLNGSFMPKEEARLSPDDRGFLFGDGVYEVVRVYDGHLFHAAEHWQRLRNSLAAVQIAPPAGTDWQGIAAVLVEKNGLQRGDATVYLQITRGAAPRKHPFPNPPVSPTIYGFANAFTPPVEKWKSGVSVVLVPDNRWARCDLKVISLLPNVLANQQAAAAGATEAIFVRNGAVTEGSHANFAAVRDGTFITHPLGNHILGGITREAVLGLCRELKIPVREFPVFEGELRALDEAMLLGTTVEVMPVVKINDWNVGNGQPGPVTLKLQQAFRELVAKKKSAV